MAALGFTLHVERDGHRIDGGPLVPTNDNAFVAPRDDLEEIRAGLRNSIAELAVFLLGEPSSRKRDEWRWGRKGSLSVQVSGPKQGLWFDHEAGKGGDALALIMRERSCDFAAALAWARSWLGMAERPAPRPRPRLALVEVEAPAVDPRTIEVRDWWEQAAKLAVINGRGSLAGTIGATYLVEHRAIPSWDVERLAALDLARFHPALNIGDNRFFRALILPATAPDGSVQAVQYVHLDRSGGKAKVETPKLSRGPLAGAAWRLPGDGDLILAEGPETGLSCWVATGRPVWVALGGVGKIADQVPTGASVTIAAENDAQDSPASTARRKAVAALEARGCRVLVAVVPADLGAKADANDVLVRDGLDAVRAMFAKAAPLASAAPLRHGLPAYYPAPTEPRDAALARQRATIADFFATTGPAAARAEIAMRRDQRIDDTLLPWQKGRITRAVKAEVRAEFEIDDLHSPGRRVLLTGAQGSGKSRAACEEIADIRAPLAVWYLVPTTAKAEEQALEYARNAAHAGSLRGYVVRGRQAADPESDERGITMCRRHEVATKASESGVKVKEMVCPECQYHDFCGYLRQDREIEEMGGRGVFFGSHQYAFLPGCPAPRPDLVVIDESVVGIAGSRIAIDPAVFGKMSGLCFRELDKSIMFRGLLGNVRDALTAYPGFELSALKAAGITADQVGRAVHLLELLETEEAESAIGGGGTDHEILGRLDDVERRNARKVAGLLRIIRAELDHSRVGLNGVRFDPSYPIKKGSKYVPEPRILGFPRRELKIKDEVPILVLDGTGDRWLNRKVFGERLLHVHVPIERDAYVTGTIEKSYSRQSLLGHGASGKPLCPDEAKRLRAEVMKVVTDMPAPAFLAACKPVVEALRREGLSDMRSGWFGALRGLNAWEECASALVVGREQPSCRDIEDATRAFLIDDLEPLVPVESYVEATRGRRMRDGAVLPVVVEVHPDLRVQAMLEQVREREIEQAMDRVRAIFNHRHLVLANRLVLDVTYDRCDRHAVLVAGGARWERALAERGVLPLKPAEMAKLFGNLWDSERSARREVEEVITPLFQIDNSYLGKGGNNSPAVVAYRVAGQRGPHPSKALVDMERHPDPAAVLAEVLGVAVTVVEGAPKGAPVIAVPVAAPPAQDDVDDDPFHDIGPERSAAIARRGAA